MDLATLDTHKARAFDAACRGQREIAERLYMELIPHYDRHGAVEGLLTLQFNRLLMALEDEDWHTANGLVDELTERLQDLHGVESAPVLAVARSIWALLRRPEPGLDPDGVSALATAAAWWTGGESPFAEPVDGVHERAEQISPETLARLPAPHGLRLVIAANAAPLAGARQGLAALAPALQNLMLGAPAVEIELGDYREAVQGADRFRAYQALVVAFEQAVSGNLPLAGDLLVEITRMEEEGLPEPLDYAPSLPIERRLKAAAGLHMRVAEAMACRAGWSAAARVQFKHVLELVARWSSRIAQRRGHSDIAGEARMAIYKARALEALGSAVEAADTLAEWLPKATRCALGPASLNSDLLLLAARLAEQAGEQAGAARLFADAAEIALPGLTRGPGLGALADRVDGAIAEHNLEGVLIAARALAGLARCMSHRGSALGHLARGLHLMVLARPHLAQHAWAKAALDVDLSMAYWGSLEAAERAVELAQILDDPQAMGLALLHRALCRMTDGDPEDRALAARDLARAATEVQEGSRGAIRITAELSAAIYPGVMQIEREPERIEVHLRRAAESGGIERWPTGSNPLDGLLPEDEQISLAAGVRLALAIGRPALAHRIAASARQGQWILDGGGPEHSWIPALIAHHRGVFERVARVGERGLFDPSVLDRMGAWRRGAPGGRPALAAGQGWLEGMAFDDGVFLCLLTHDQITPYWWSIERADLEAMIHALPSLLHPAALQRDLGRWCKEAYGAFIAPFAERLEGIEQLTIAVDSPLTEVPFSLLYQGGFLCEQVALRIACPVPERCRPEELFQPPAPAVAVILGDGATARDLQISTLAQEGHYSTVEVRHGADVEGDSLHQSIPRARIAYLIGEITEAGMALSDEGAPISAEQLAKALSAAGVTCAIIQHPLERAVAQRFAQRLLVELPCVLGRRWETGEEGPAFLMDYLRAASMATDVDGYAGALRAARREAVEARMPPHQWGAYGLWSPEWC